MSNNTFNRITEESSYEKSILKLDDYQREVAISDIENIAIKAPAGSGKALCNGTKVLTSNGWKNIEKLELNDLVAGSDGKFHKLLGIYPQGKKQIYRVIFSDNSEIKCSPSHLWTYFRDYRFFSDRHTKTIKEIYESKELEDYDIYIPTVAPIEFINSDISNDNYCEYKLTIGGNCYTISTVNDRKKFLYDIISIFGSKKCIKSHQLASKMCIKSRQLALNIQYICESLGYVAILTPHKNYIEVTIENFRRIKAIIPTDEFYDMTCIAIDSKDHLFVTEHFILTHNTTTLIAAIASYRYNYINDKICAITYTRAARAEMEERLKQLEVYDVNVTTIHVWSRNILQDLSVKYNFKVRILEELAIKVILKELVDEYIKKSKTRIKSINVDILFNYIFGSKKIDITDNFKRTLNALERRYIQYKEDNFLYDFTDFPRYLYDVLMTYNERIKNIDALFVDEFQDVDEKILKLFNLVETNKKFFIGDAWQCQPFQTKVIVKEENKDLPVEKNIEDISIKDMILTYQPKTNKKWLKTFKKVINKEIYSYKNDYIISITTANNCASSYTSNHRAIIHIENIKKYVLCLILNENNCCKLKIINLADKNRFKELKESRGSIWFLESFDNEQLAKNKMTYIDNCYYISSNFELTNLRGLIDCLKLYELDIKYPLIDYKNCDNYFVQVYAINLFPDIMSCINMNGMGIKWVTINSVKKIFIDNEIKVCGLKVENGTYIADKILTHNSIFQFRGADGEVFNKLDNFTIFKLKQNYRSYQEIIDYATNVYLKLFNDAADGKECYISSIMDSNNSKIKCIRGYGGELYVINPYGCIYSNNNNFIDVQDLFNYFLDLEPMILCRTNKQVKRVKELGYFNVDTIHQAKGLEYDDVIVLDTTITSTEDLNIAYVAMTRAKNKLLIINWQQFELWFKIYMNHNSFGGF